MIAFMEQFSPIIQALLGTLFTWALTALGAALVFLTKDVSRKMLNGLLGFASGVMIAASYWSLLAPAIELSENLAVPSWFPALTGFLLGGAFLFLVDKLLPHMHMSQTDPEGPKSSWQRSVLLITAITLHNIPEGLAVGVSPSALAFRTFQKDWLFPPPCEERDGKQAKPFTTDNFPAWSNRLLD